MERTTMLQSVSLFSRLDHRHLKTILKACTERIFESGEMIVEQGHPGIGLFIILEGKAEITKTLRNGENVHIAYNGPGDVIGEMSVLDGAMRTASAKALTQTSCLILSAWSFKSLMERRPEVALGILPVIVHRFRETDEALMALSARHEAKSAGNL